jgi:hypothetical protein
MWRKQHNFEGVPAFSAAWAIDVECGAVHCVCCTFVYSPKKKNSPRGNMRTLIALALSTTLIASAAFAADAGPLAAGKPAGVKQAQLGTTGWVLIGVGAVAGIAIIAASSGNGSPVQPQNNLAVTTTTI